jgi:hypothetical protein
VTYLRVLLSLIISLGVTAVVDGQQACKAEMSVGVINSNGESFRGLAPEDFLAHGPKGVGVRSVTYDDGPRRLLMVVDTSKKLSAGAHKAEIEIVKSIIAASRPEDSLGLIIARGPGGLVKFGENRSGLLDALDSNSSTGSGRGVLDAVMEGIEWFSDSHPGDAIVLIASSTEGNHKTNARSVARALASHHIRLFGLALGPVMTRNVSREGVVTSTTSQGMAYATAGIGDFVYDTGDQDFYPLTMNSGGVVVSVMNEQSQQGGDRTADPRFQQFLKSRAQVISNAVQAFYRVQIDGPRISHPEGWSLEIKESIRKSSPAMFVLYDHELGPC